MSFKINDQVKVKGTVLTGTVTGASVDQTTLEVQYLVNYTDKDGEPQHRYFAVSDLEAA